MKKIILLLFVLLPIQLFAVKGTDHYEGIIILDRTCPQIHVVSQTNHQVIAQESITIRGDYIESNLESITIGTQSCQIMTNARAFKLTNYPLVKGNNIIPMNASDLAGNHSAYTLVLFRQSDQFVILPGQTNIVTYSNLGLMIPPGAIQSNDVITVKVETNVGIPANLTSISPIFDLSKSSNNNCFDTPIEISIHYDPAKIPPGFTEEDIRIYVREKWQTEWAVTKFKSIDKINHIITAEIPCFSDYTVGALSQPDAPSSGSANGSGTGGLPAANPWTGIDQVTQPQPGPDGACHVSFPFRLLPMKFGPQPNMNLEYNSSVGFTVCGIGWDLPIDYIERSTKNGVPFYNNRDKFDHTGDDLVLTHGIWLTKQAGKYAKHIYNAGNDSWLVNDKNGNLYYYGTTPSSKENGTSLSNTSGTYRWYLTKIVDAYGNILENKYIVNGGKSYLQEIDYGGDNSSALARSITFEYEPRPDQLAFSTSGVNITNRNRLSRVHTGLEDYNLLYSTSLNSFRSLLTKVQVLNSGVLLYETALQYQQGKPSFTNACNANGNGISFTESQTHGAYLGDFNGDGSQELLCTLKSGSLILLHDIKYDAISNRFVNMGSSYSASFPENTSIVIGDFTGNGKDEIMNIDQSQITIGSLVNGASSRTFQTSYQYPYSVLPNGYTGDDVYIYDDPPWCNGYNIYRYFDLSSIIGVGDIDKTRKDTAAIGVYYDLVGVYFTGTSFKYSYITYQIVSYCFSKNGYVEATNLTGVSHYLFGSICDLSGMGNSKIAFFNKWNVCDQHALTDLNGDKKDDLIYSTYLANTDGQLGNIHIELSSNAGIPDPDDESLV